MANQLPPTLPAPATIALLDQEDLDEMTGHLANMDAANHRLMCIAAEQSKLADEAKALKTIYNGISARVRALIAERSSVAK